jgi:hypothetical protein
MEAVDMEAGLLGFVITMAPAVPVVGEQQLECGIVVAKSGCEWSMNY